MELLGKYHYTLPPKPSPEHFKAINKTLKEWVNDNNLNDIYPFLMVAQTAQGYGYIENIPALYGLWWLDTELIHGYEKMALGGPKIPTILTGGFSSLWRNLYYQEKLDVKFNVQIKSIRRNRDKTPNIQITYQENNQMISSDFDWLIIAAPLTNIIPLFTNPQPFESELVSALKPMTIITHLIDANDKNDYSKTDEAILTWPNSLVLKNEGHVYTVRNTAKALMDRTNIDLPQGRFSYVTYQLFNRVLTPTEEAQATTTMIKDLEGYGLSNIKVIEARPRTYFYHFDLEGLSVKHYPWQILDYQGTLNTLFIGASVSFESMNDVVNYNLMLMDEYLQFT